MAHEIEGNYAFFGSNTPAWHGLGTVLKDAPTIDEAWKLGSKNMKNPNCENRYCLDAYGEIRVLPTGPCTPDGTRSLDFGSNALLCRTCYHHEMRYRRDRNSCMSPSQVKEHGYKLPAWESLKVYDPGEVMALAEEAMTKFSKALKKLAE